MDLAIPVTTFAAPVVGRREVPGDTIISGDQGLGRRVLEPMVAFASL